MISTTVVRSINMKISGQAILKLLDIPDNATNVKIVFAIPGGGDYSNHDYDFIDEELVKVSYDVVSTDD